MNPVLGFGRAIANTFFREVVISGRDRLPTANPVIFTPNHPNGLLDPILLFFLSPPFRLRFVAKAPLFRIPVFGSLLKSVGAIPVMRKMEATGDVDYTAFFSACVDALCAGDSIVIFPEGRSLPQSYLAPLKTGPSRLFFMARQKGADVKIVPVGLNYEKGTTFRSDVLIAVAPPLDTVPFEQQHRANPQAAVRELTEAIGESLKDHVVQAETYREKELLQVVERIYGEAPDDEDWQQRFARLKDFEEGLQRLRSTSPDKIEELRGLVARYERLSNEYRVERSPKSWLLALLPVAAIGWILNAIPYHVVDLLVRRSDASDAATFKVVYSLFAFPIAYALEGWAIAHFFGSNAAIVFALLIIPLSYFSQFMSDWWKENSPGLLTGSTRERAARQLERLRTRIVSAIDAAAEATTKTQRLEGH